MKLKINKHPMTVQFCCLNVYFCILVCILSRINVNEPLRGFQWLRVVKYIIYRIFYFVAIYSHNTITFESKRVCRLKCRKNKINIFNNHYTPHEPKLKLKSQFFLFTEPQMSLSCPKSNFQLRSVSIIIILSNPLKLCS